MGRRGWLAVAVGSALVGMCLLALCGLAGAGVWIASRQAGTPPGRATPVVAQGVTATPVALPTKEPMAPTPEPTEASADPTPPAQATVTEAPPATTEPSPAPDDAESATLAALEAVTIPERDLYELALSFGLIPDGTPRVVSETDPGYVLGDEETFNVSNIATQEEFTVQATLQAQTAHASWWVAEDIRVDQDDLDESARVFEEQSYPTNRTIFGEEWSPGVDGDPRVHIFLGDVPGVGGYYSSSDEFPSAINPNSNEKEIFYLNFNNAQPGDPYFDGILAHEFQHMIHWNQDKNEELWINEGSAELASQINGFDVGSGPSAYARETDIPVTRWEDQTHPFYGSAFLFMDYFYGRFGAKAVSALIRSPLDGARGFDEVLAAEGLTFNDLFADWTVATLLDTDEVGDGRYDYPSDTAREPAPAEEVDRFPQADEGEVYQYGTDYILLEPPRQGGTLAIEFSGDQEVALVPTEPHSGAWMLWSNRGDDSHSASQRAFDLTGLNAATLRFWTWYELESEYDYAYVSVSTDGGAHWTLLPAGDTTEKDPHGNSFGPAFTGKSGHPPDEENERDEPQWVQQEVDLSAYAGQEILVGFHTITDDALNRTGFVVDDISLPELDYQEDFEEGDGGWEHRGFVRVDNLIPQRFLVQAVAEGDGEPQVFPLELDANNAGTLSVPSFGEDVERVTLIVTGASGYSAQRTRYEYEVRVE